MLRTTLLGLVFAHLTLACSVVVDERDDGAANDGASDETGTSSADDGGSTIDGASCSALHGRRTLPSWNGDQSDDVYPRSLFSFTHDSTDIDVVRNDGDLLYVDNMFSVVTVTDDRSFIVDLGNVPLTAVPETLDPGTFPTGNWGEHDYIQAVLDHTYVVRTEDSETRQWAAFRIVGLAPGNKVTFDWILSTDPERLLVPTPCL